MGVYESVSVHVTRPRGGAGDPRTDAELLLSFARFRDEAAFAALARRHGPMVRGVCRRLLGDEHTAEDAAQAAFLVLARRAEVAARATSAGGWLHGVARRCAAKMATRSRPAGPPADAFAPGWADPAGAAAQAELRRALDEEIARLGADDREAVVLHFLEGLSYTRAAERLGCPRGTLVKRVGRARASLRSRLAGRGFDPASAEAWALAALVTAPAGGALAWAGRAASAAGSVVTGSTAGVSPAAARVFAEVTMGSFGAWKLTLAGLAAVAVVGMGLAQYPTGGGSAGGAAGSDLRQEYLDMVRRRVAGMTADQVKDAIKNEKEAARRLEAERRLEELIGRLKSLAREYPETPAGAKARWALGVLAGRSGMAIPLSSSGAPGLSPGGRGRILPPRRAGPTGLGAPGGAGGQGPPSNSPRR